MTPASDQFICEVSENMPGWAAKPRPNGGLQLVRLQDGLAIYAHHDRFKSRTTWTMDCYNAEPYRTRPGRDNGAFVSPLSYNEKAPTIGANPASGARKVARALLSRLVPDCEEIHAKGLAAVASVRDYDSRQASLADLLGVALDSHNEATIKFADSTKGYRYADVEVLADHVNIKISNLSPEKAKRVLAALRE